MSTPTITEFIGALLIIEQYLRVKITELMTRFPESKEFLEDLLARLNASAATLEVLGAVSKELSAFVSGKGPVSHDPVDLA